MSGNHDTDREQGSSSPAPGDPEATEHTPLLGAPSQPQPIGPPEPVIDDPRALYRQNVVIIIFAILFLLELGVVLTTPPMNAIGEDFLCRQHFPDQYAVFDPDDRKAFCRNPAVQKELAMLRGWSASLESFAGLAAAIPFGILSDRWGRRPVLSLSIFGATVQLTVVGIILSRPDVFPSWAVWATSIIILAGGGGFVAIAMMYTFVADVVPQAERAAVFFQLGAIVLVGLLVGNPVAAVLMRRSPWLAFITGTAILYLVNLIVWVLPETNELHKHAREQARQSRTQGSANDHAGSNSHKAMSTFQLALQQMRSSASESMGFIASNKRVSVLICALAFLVAGRWSQEMVLQYATNRYNWDWSEATFLLSVGTISNIVILLAVLPALNRVLVSYVGLSGPVKDLLLARASSVVMILGFLILAFSWNGYVLALGLVVMSCGAGLSALVRSLANAMVEEHHIGILNSLIGLMEAVALMMAGPLLSSALSAGINLGGAWIGLPFLCAALMCLVALVILLAFRLPRKPSEDDEAAQEAIPPTGEAL